MADIPNEFFDWLASAGREGGSAGDDPDGVDLQRYFYGIARARFVLRKIFRMIDSQAKRSGIDPLEHQALIQVYGADIALQVNEVAELLDIPPAFASRIVKSLEGKGLVSRTASLEDRRTTLVSSTIDGRRLLEKIDDEVQRHVRYFQQQLSDVDRALALGIFAFYVGAAPAREHFSRLEALIRAD